MTDRTASLSATSTCWSTGPSGARPAAARRSRCRSEVTTPNAAYNPAMESPIETPVRDGGRSGSPTSARRPPWASATAAKPGRGARGPVCPNAETRATTRSGFAAWQPLRGQAPPVQRPGAEVLQQRVAVADEVQDDVLARLGPQVEHDGPLAPVERPVEQGGLPGVQAPLPQLVAVRGRSTLTTSAPTSASNRPAVGAAM